MTVTVVLLVFAVLRLGFVNLLDEFVRGHVRQIHAGTSQKWHLAFLLWPIFPDGNRQGDVDHGAFVDVSQKNKRPASCRSCLRADMVRPIGVEPTQDAVPETAALSTELRARDDLYYRTYFKEMQMKKMENDKKSFEGREVPPPLRRQCVDKVTAGGRSTFPASAPSLPTEHKLTLAFGGAQLTPSREV
jgi:hypothetical protein